MGNKEKKEGLRNLDMLIQEIARTRRILVLFEGMKEAEVDEIINKLCTKHHKKFSNMSKGKMIVDMFKVSLSLDPERTLDALFDGGD